MKLAPTVALAAASLVACAKDPPAPPAPAAPAATATAPAAGSGQHRRKHEDRRDPAVAPTLSVAVAVNGAAATWQKDAFDKVAQFTGNAKASDGEAREVWSLRDLAHALVGPTARVTAVAGDDGTQAITAAAWQDTARTPLLHTTRRGTLKFRWADAHGAWLDTEVKDVSRIELAQ
jgi:hypothetical protein